MAVIAKTNISGVYQIINLVNGHRYIGSSNNFTKRVYSHMWGLRCGKHFNAHLQKAWNKYGESSFAFEILLTCHSDMTLWYEQQFLNQLKPEYNIARDAIAPTKGRRMSDLTKENMSKARKGHPNYLHSQSESARRKISIAGLGRKKTEEQRAAISKRMMGNKNSAGCKSWLGKTFSDEHRTRLSKSLSKHYGKVISPSRQIFDITNLYKFCKEHGLNNYCMRLLFMGKQEAHKGWTLCP